jgi:hypothetical protein
MKIFADSPHFPRDRIKKLKESELWLRLAEHLIKISAYPKYPARDHWQVEIRAFLKKLANLNTKYSTVDKTKKVRRRSVYLPDEDLNALLEDAFYNSFEGVFEDASPALHRYFDEDFSSVEWEDLKIQINSYVKDGAILYRLLKGKTVLAEV